MAPVSQYASLKKVYSAENLQRFNLFGSIPVNGQAADGYSSGDAIKAIEEVASRTLPQGYSYDFGGMSRTERESSNAIGIILTLSIIFIYIILSMMYESYLIPFAVLLSVPFGLAGSFMFAKLFGLDNNIYLQMGLVMLIGLIAKTAILLTYAQENSEARLQTIEDKLAIKEVVDIFSNLVDTKEIDKQVLLFTEDGVVKSYSNGQLSSELTGRTALKEAFAGFLANFHTVYHQNGQQTIDELTANSAKTTSYCRVILVGERDGKSTKTTMYTVYKDELVKQSGVWLIKIRTSNFIRTETEEMK